MGRKELCTSDNEREARMTAKPKFPDECCGVCRRAHTDIDQLVCYANPPQVLLGENGEEVSTRGAAIEPTDPPCWAFVPRHHA